MRMAHGAISGLGGVEVLRLLVRFVWLGVLFGSPSEVAMAAVSDAEAEIFLQNCSTIQCSDVVRKEQVISYNPKLPPQMLTLLLPYDGSAANLSIFSLERVDLQSLLLNYDLFPEVVQRNGRKYYALYVKAPGELSDVSSLSTSYKLTFTWLKPDDKDKPDLDSSLAMTVQPGAGSSRVSDRKAAIAYVLFREAVIIGNSVDRSASAEVSSSACSNSLQVPDRRSVVAHWIMLAAMLLLVSWLRLCRLNLFRASPSSQNKNAD